MRVKFVLQSAAAIWMVILGVLSSQPAHSKASDWISFLQTPVSNYSGVWTAVRFFHGNVECASQDGVNCLDGTAADAIVNDHHFHDLTPVVCGHAGYNTPSHWCSRAFAQHYATWASAARIGLKLLFSVNPDGYIQCLSENGVDCLSNFTDLSRLEWDGSLFEHLKAVACSTDDYSTPKHWCKRIKENFANPAVPGVNPGDCIAIAEGNGVDEPAKVWNTNLCTSASSPPLPTGVKFFGIERNGVTRLERHWYSQVWEGSPSPPWSQTIVGYPPTLVIVWTGFQVQDPGEPTP